MKTNAQQTYTHRHKKKRMLCLCIKSKMVSMVVHIYCTYTNKFTQQQPIHLNNDDDDDYEFLNDDDDDDNDLLIIMIKFIYSFIINTIIVYHQLLYIHTHT